MSPRVGQGEWILLVEDDEEISELLHIYLETEGFNVVVARDGEEGEQLFAHHTPSFDLVLSDLGLPKVGGVELYRRIRLLRPSVKVIASSAYTHVKVIDQLLKDGVRAFIPKPYYPRDLLRTIRNVLDS